MSNMIGMLPLVNSEYKVSRMSIFFFCCYVDTRVIVAASDKFWPIDTKSTISQSVIVQGIKWRMDIIRVTTCSVFLWGVVVPTGVSYGELCAQCEHLPPVIRTPVTIIHDKQSVLSPSFNFVVPSQFNPSQVMSTADSPTKPTAARPQLPYSHMNPFLSPGWFNFLSPVFFCFRAYMHFLAPPWSSRFT